ncbi:hypothetical protein ACLVWQ_07545 [Streptomyces sp. CWNU-52B]|uniref:hypothetical protein n=1 Tax=unclassified Streptomyces TaxID=2593676 RepID=UPI0039BEE1A5
MWDEPGRASAANSSPFDGPPDSGFSPTERKGTVSSGYDYDYDDSDSDYGSGSGCDSGGQGDRVATGQRHNSATVKGEAFVITGLPGPPPGDTASLPTATGSGGNRTDADRLDDGRPDDDRTGLWNRLGDRKATAVTAAAAGLVLLGVLLVMSMITDGITFTSDRTEPAGGDTSVVSPSDQNTRPEEPATPAAPPVAADPSPTDLPTASGTSADAPDDDDDDDEGEEDDEEDDDDDDDDDEHENDDDDDDYDDLG